MGRQSHMQSGKKVDFGKKTPKAHVRESASAHPQMRLVVSQNGEITHANDAFAACVGVPPLDLNGRRLLDSVLFENFDDFGDDRAVFNNMSHGDTSSISSLREGIHTLIIGRDSDHVPFYFNWMTGHDHSRYLVAHSVTRDEDESVLETQKPDWSSILGSLIPSNVQPTQDAEPQKQQIKGNSKLKPALKKASGKPVHKAAALTADDVKKIMTINQDLMCLMTLDGTFLRQNDAFSTLFNPSIPSFLTVVDDEFRAQVRQCLQSLSTHDTEDGINASTVEFEARMVTKDNKTAWFHWRVNKEGETLYVLGHDITAAKMNEAVLLRRDQELSEAQALANMGNWRWSVGSETIEWSDQIYKIFGVTREEFTPTLDNTNNLLHKRDIGRMMQAFQRAIIEQNDYDMDFRVIRDDGSTRYVRCEGRCELDSDGDAIALYGVMQDITGQTEHEMELREAKDSAEQAYAAKSRFLANMSHELRTPLNAIIGFSDMIQRQMLGPLGSEKYVDYATNIKDSGEHLLDLITDILDMSKIEAGKYDLDLEEVQLGALVNTAVRMIESRANEGVLTLNNNVKTEEPLIVADRRAVMQILLNVLSNAVKFTEPGGKITVACEEFDNHVTVKITDTGIGIPANKLNAVMRPFEQVSTAFTRNHEGSGLGLAITKELAELHGGLLYLESTVGHGTTASLRLPRNAKVKA